MGLIPAIRAQLPVGDVAHQSGAADMRGGARQPQGPAAPISQPVTAPVLLDAVPEAAAKPPGGETHFLAAQDRTEGAAAAKAEAARAAYIRASIAAGVSPLPLPGL
ncbi:hypothetical protein [Tabrizicola sp.]|uniref:hypothetical protein n=1 Tax=Tabrizicola sp. TaxID=2005166 RepID=UPI00261DC3DE|nr:hypothetical protein [Tabrizicola sp.]MDM7930913.1 hypothetical protein [Tabrizicola sp.]